MVYFASESKYYLHMHVLRAVLPAVARAASRETEAAPGGRANRALRATLGLSAPPGRRANRARWASGAGEGRPAKAGRRARRDDRERGDRQVRGRGIFLFVHL